MAGRSQRFTVEITKCNRHFYAKSSFFGSSHLWNISYSISLTVIARSITDVEFYPNVLYNLGGNMQSKYRN